MYINVTDIGIEWISIVVTTPNKLPSQYTIPSINAIRDITSVDGALSLVQYNLVYALMEINLSILVSVYRKLMGGHSAVSLLELIFFDSKVPNNEKR